MNMNMPLQVSIGNLSLTIPARPLTTSAFAPYGDVIHNPRPSILPPVSPSTLSSLPYNPAPANQGSAIKYQNVSRPRNLYAQCPSRTPAELAMSLFVCRARKLLSASEAGVVAARAQPPDVPPLPHADDQVVVSEADFSEEADSFFRKLQQHTHDHIAAQEARPPRKERPQSSYFPVTILERHPYTSQTFIPLSDGGRYLVIVAPSVYPSQSYPALPTPRGKDLPGPGLPDLARLEAFVAEGDQAVTYGAGTWHAPMMVLGGEEDKLDFVVVQFQNGVGREDCQEVLVQGRGEGGRGILVEIPGGADGGARTIRSKL
jgi:ureidoglycolate lyase